MGRGFVWKDFIVLLCNLVVRPDPNEFFLSNVRTSILERQSRLPVILHFISSRQQLYSTLKASWNLPRWQVCSQIPVVRRQWWLLLLSWVYHPKKNDHIHHHDVYESCPALSSECTSTRWLGNRRFQLLSRAGSCLAVDIETRQLLVLVFLFCRVRGGLTLDFNSP